MTKTTEPVLARCMGGNRCNHIPGTCTATNEEYQAKAKARPHPAPSPDVAGLVERLREQAWTITHTEAADRIEAIEAENERLRGALDAVWKEATTMRNASKLVGPYPTNPADNRIWARSMYHAGKRIMEMLKPARAALKEIEGD